MRWFSKTLDSLLYEDKIFTEYKAELKSIKNKITDKTEIQRLVISKNLCNRILNKINVLLNIQASNQIKDILKSKK